MDVDPRSRSGPDGSRRLVLAGLVEAEGAGLRAGLAPFAASDWQSAVAIWRSHRVAALVWSRLAARGVLDVVPVEIRGVLEGDYRRSVAYNLGLRAQATRVIRRFAEGGIPLVHLKGFHLAEIIHGDVGSRMIRDLDFLVPRAEIAVAEEWMIADGYGPAVRPTVETQCARHRHLVPFTHERQRPVEIHWTIETDGGPFTVDVDGLFARAVTASIGGVPARILAIEDLLLSLCLGAAYQDQFNLGLRAVADVTAVLRYGANTIDWRSVLTRSSEWRVTRCLYLTLLHARDLMAAPVPEDVLAGIRPRDFDPALLDWSRERIFVHEPDRHHVLSPAMARFALEPSWSAKLGILRRSLLSARGSEFPGRPRRWAALFRERSRMMWGLLRRNPRSIALARRVHRKRLLQDWLAADNPDDSRVEFTVPARR